MDHTERKRSLDFIRLQSVDEENKKGEEQSEVCTNLQTSRGIRNPTVNRDSEVTHVRDHQVANKLMEMRPTSFLSKETQRKTTMACQESHRNS